MTDHARKIIRGAIAARLSEEREPGIYWTPAAGRVFSSRTRALRDVALPAILVYARSEPIDEESYPKSGEDGTILRELRVGIEAVARARDDLDDELDDLALGVENALEWFEVPGFETATIRLSETDIDDATDGEAPFGAIRLTYTVRYRTPYRVTDLEPPVYDTVFLGFSPRIGADHVEDYIKIYPRGEE